MRFRKILLAFDISDGSIRAAEYAIHISELEKAYLVFVHVIDDIKQGGVIGLRARYGDIDLVDAYLKVRKDKAKEFIQPLQKKANDKGIESHIELLEENENSKIGIITKYIEENNIDLVVVGSRGLSKFQQLLGSFASELTRNSKCPVMVTR
ncbi:MAG TPA: universal stress protein [Nitrososphaeraceae archaeon]|nr:universal stress protein [Nitrososphaeraceae archaeon]